MRPSFAGQCEADGAGAGDQHLDGVAGHGCVTADRQPLVVLERSAGQTVDGTPGQRADPAVVFEPEDALHVADTALGL